MVEQRKCIETWRPRHSHLGQSLELDLPGGGGYRGFADEVCMGTTDSGREAEVRVLLGWAAGGSLHLCPWGDAIPSPPAPSHFTCGRLRLGLDTGWDYASL